MPKEKPSDGTWVNAGFFVMEPEVFDYLEDDSTVLEGTPLEALSRKGELLAYKHSGFWQPMDILRDKQLLEKLWQTGEAPWKVWENNKLGVLNALMIENDFWSNKRVFINGHTGFSKVPGFAYG